jgi:nitrate reductase cytochrome c-type subunit
MDFLTPMQKSDKEFVGQYICSGAHGIVVTEKRTLTRSLKSSHICARVLIINWFFYTHMVSRWRRKLREASEQAAINSNVWRSQKKKKKLNRLTRRHNGHNFWKHSIIFHSIEPYSIQTSHSAGVCCHEKSAEWLGRGSSRSRSPASLK